MGEKRRSKPASLVVGVDGEAFDPNTIGPDRKLKKRKQAGPLPRDPKVVAIQRKRHFFRGVIMKGRIVAIGRVVNSRNIDEVICLLRSTLKYNRAWGADRERRE